MKALFILLLFTVIGLSQDDTVSLRILAFPRIADDSPVELLVGDRTIPIKLASNRLSDPYKVAAQSAWNFGIKDTGDDGKPSFKSYGSGTAKDTQQQIVVLLRRGLKNSDGFRVLSYADGPRHFKERQIMFLNLALENVAGEVGGEKFALKPAQNTVISPKADQGKDLCHAKLLLERKGKWRPFMESNWPLKPDTRGLIFLYTDPKSSKVRLHTIRDFL